MRKRAKPHPDIRQVFFVAVMKQAIGGRFAGRVVDFGRVKHVLAHETKGKRIMVVRLRRINEISILSHTHPRNRPFTHSLARSLVTRSFTHSLAHSLDDSLTR